MLFDLSAVTDGLISVVRNAWPHSPLWAELGLSAPSFTPNFSGLSPEAMREEQGPQLGLFLYHVEQNNAQESIFWAPEMQHGGAAPSTFLPLAINAYYLLSAHASGLYAQEQQAMSVAMRVFHATPVLASDTTDTPAWSLTMTMERRSYDELSLLWQATTAPLRLGVVYRAAVIFVQPDTAPAAAHQVTTVDVTLNGTDHMTITTADVSPPA